MPAASRSRPVRTSRAALPPPAPLYTGRLIAVTDGQVLVRLDGSADSRTVSMAEAADPTVIAQAVRDGVPVLLQADGAALRVIGLLQPLTAPARREIVAAEQLVLRSGEASLTLTAAGKALLRGGYVSSWSNGVNRIVGRTVRLD